MAIGWDEANPQDNSIVSQYPDNERAQRAVQASAWALEHDDVEGRHSFGVGNTAARDAITTWTTGAIFINTSAGTGGVIMQAVTSVTASVPGWENLRGAFSSADETKLDAVISATSATSAEAAAGAETGMRIWSPAIVKAAVSALIPIADVSAIEAGINNTQAITPSGLNTALGLSEQFVSAEQTITAGGSLTLAHGLSGVPQISQVMLVCKTAQLGYSVDDEVFVNAHFQGDGTSRGVAIVPDATNLNIRYGSDGTTFVILNKTTGTSAGITNGNWKAKFVAWG